VESLFGADEYPTFSIKSLLLERTLMELYFDMTLILSPCPEIGDLAAFIEAIFRRDRMHLYKFLHTS
jgi:hypothetical protein